jgi:hypothetical protein
MHGPFQHVGAATAEGQLAHKRGKNQKRRLDYGKRGRKTSPMTGTAGTVSPMVASAEPRHTLTTRCR